MKIKEIQRTPSEGPPDSAARPTQKRMPDGVKRIPGAPNLGYLFTGGRGQVVSVFTGANYLLSLYDLKRSAEIGWLAMRSTSFPFPKSMQVANVKIHDEYRGRGMGQSLYGVAIKILGVTLVADDTQTPEARRLWANLHSVPGVSVRGWISFPAQMVMPEFDDYSMFDAEQNLRKIAQLQRLPRGQQPQPLVEPKDGYDDAYFDFPVVSGPDGQELKAAKNIAAIYTRNHPEDNRNDYEVGLFARWPG